MTSPTTDPSFASSLLSLYLLRAGLEPDVQASYKNQKWLKEIGERLSTRMAASEDYPNKAYNGLAEAITLSITLYDTYPDAYAQMICGIATNDFDGFLDSFDGLRRLDMLANGLADDHDYVFNEAYNRIEHSSPDNSGLRGFCAAEFLVRVQQAMVAGEMCEQQSDTDGDAPTFH